MNQETELKLAADISRFYADPLAFVMYAYPWGMRGTLLEHFDGPDLWQLEFLQELGSEIKKRDFDGVHAVMPIRMSRASGHGVGKSTLAAWLVNFILSTRPRSKGTVTANSFQQLETKTWAAIQHWTKLCVTKHWFDVSTDRIWHRSYKESWFCSAQSCKEENSEAFAGQHAIDSTSFYIFDEASAIPDKIWEVAEGGLTDGEPMIFVFGNPTRNAGKFVRVNYGEERNRWLHGCVDSRSSKFANHELHKEWIEQYGEDSDFVRIRVRGECPRAGNEQFIPQDIVAAARKYKVSGNESLPRILTCDPARYGDDRTVIGLRQGRLFRVLAKLRGINTVDTAFRVIEIWDKLEPDAVVVDGDGLGAGVIDQLRHQGYRDGLHEFRGGLPALNANKYFNRRAEVWDATREWLSAGAQIPDDPEMETDLTGPRYGFDAKGRIQLEQKKDMKARGMASPDLGDALALSFAVKVLAKRKPKRLAPRTQFAGTPYGWMGI